MEISFYIYDAFIFSLSNLSEKAMVIVTENVAQVLVVFHI